MTGGLLELVAKGAQDIFLTGNPSVTFFKSIYKKHTNFSFESVQQSLVGDQNFGKLLTCKIDRKGDLLSGITLEIDLPVIQSENKEIEGETKYLEWIDSIGHYIIQEVSITIGEQEIDKHYGEWMEIWNELTLNEEHSSGYKQMVGKTGTRIKEKTTLIIPLQFWFCRNIGSALPLAALQYHEVKILLKLRNFEDLWHQDIAKFNVKRNTSGVVEILDSNSDFETNMPAEAYSGISIIWKDDLEENKISLDSGGALVFVDDNTKIQLDGSSYTEKTGEIYIVKFKPIKPEKITDIRIFCDYIYLDVAERKFFSQNSHNYLIEQVQYNGADDYSKGTITLKSNLEFNHPCKEILWVNQLKINNRFNQLNNYSNGIIVNDNINKNDNIEDVLLMLNGQDRFVKRNGRYFRLLVPYQRHTRTPDKYIYAYSFSLNPEQIQPSGSCNFSRLDNSELLINMKTDTLDSQLRVYAVNYNILKIINGMGGLAYSN